MSRFSLDALCGPLSALNDLHLAPLEPTSSHLLGKVGSSPRRKAQGDGMIHKYRAWARRQKGDSSSHQPFPRIHSSLATCPTQSRLVDLRRHTTHLGRHPLGCQPSLVDTFPDGPGSAILLPPCPTSAWACQCHDRNEAVRALEVTFPQEKAAKAPRPQPGHCL